jgi:four helix bundle suffix protein
MPADRTQLITVATFLLDRQLAAQAEAFEREGGF